MFAGIIGSKYDPHVQILKKKLEDRGCEADIIDLLHTPLIFSKKEITINEKMLSSYDAFYIRQIPYLIPPKFFKKISKEEWEELYEEYIDLIPRNMELMSLFTSLIKLIDDEALCINPFETLFLQFLKPWQFYLLAKNNLPIPPYIVTNFIPDKHDFGIVKPLGSYAKVQIFKNKMRDERKPLILQKFVKGRVMRASLLEDEFIGCVEIEHRGIDYRGENAIYRKVEIEEEDKETLFKCIESLGMRYTEIDFIKREEKIFILDCNPSPGFMVLEEKAKLPISDKIAEYMIRNAR